MSKLSTCRGAFAITEKEQFGNVFSLVHDRSAGRRTRFAQFSLGAMYANCQGVQQDLVMAVKYFKLAADQGFAGAQYALGAMYAKGQGVQQDDREAATYFKLAAKQGDPNAITALGIVFSVGTRVQVTGLTSNSDLNGAAGTVTKALNNGRAVVVLDGQTKPQSIRHFNLEPL